MATNEEPPPIPGYLEGRIAEQSAFLQELSRRIDSGLQAVNQRMDSGLQEVNQRMDSGLQAVNQRMDSGLQEVNQRMDSGLQEVNRRIDRLFLAILGVGGAILAALIVLIVRGL
jgi:ElaB/YqjD/DUF883 family membrane-anchored ribosome-binding protein